MLRDISVRKREAERIRYLAEHDSLTGLANRNTLHASLVGDDLRTPRQQGGKVALLVLGLDKFQQINDMLGHACGDRVLRAVAERLKAALPATGIVARLSGDEFAIALPSDDIGRKRSAVRRADRARIRRAARWPERASTASRSASARRSIRRRPNRRRTAEQRHLALCRAKAAGRGGHVVFERAIRQELESRLTLEAELALAAERNEFELFYQPQVRLADGRLIGAEALIRWRHPVRGLVSPAEFMPLVNTSSISDRIALWVMETACRQARPGSGPGHNVRLGVNLSPSQLQSGDLAASVAEMLDAPA